MMRFVIIQHYVIFDKRCCIGGSELNYRAMGADRIPQSSARALWHCHLSPQLWWLNGRAALL